MRIARIRYVLAIAAIMTQAAQAADVFVSPDGNATNAGTEQSPWDIASAWGGKQKIAPGSTIHMMPGVYRHPQREWAGGGFVMTLAGSAEAPIHIKPHAGGRVTIDGGLTVHGSSQYVWMWDMEFTISESAQWNRRITEKGSHPRPAIDQPQGGITVNGGKGSKFINLVVHDNNSTGIAIWRGAVDAEVHGCLIYNNGWIGPDRFHGPGIYTQNETGNKWITDNILFGNYSTTIQAYGSKNAWVDGFRIIGNISFAPMVEGGRARFLIGGGRPSKDIVVSENILHRVPLQVGYTAPHNEDCVVHDNVLVNAKMSISKYKQVDQKNNITIDAKAARPDRPHDAYLRPNKYDPNRANLALFNWQRAPEVAVDFSGFLTPGQKFRVVNAMDFFGPPVVESTFDGKPVAMPVPANADTGKGEFCAYVVFRSPAK